MKNSYRFEHILREVGAGRKWHLYVMLLIGCVSVMGGLHNMSSVMLMFAPDHWCRVDVDLEAAARNNWTSRRLRELAIPRTQPDGAFSKCEYYVRNYSQLLSESWSEMVANWTSDDVEVAQCTSWEFDTSHMKSTLVTQWNLVCHNTAYASMGKSAYMFGMLFGSLIFGSVSDRYGRRRSALLAVVQYVTSASMVVIVPHYFLFLTFRMLTGMAAIGLYMCIYVLMNETVLPHHRGFIQVFSNVFFALGIMALPGVAFLAKEWKHYYAMVTMASFSMLSFFWILPESPRWLIQHGRKEEARRVVRRIANMSGRRHITDERLMTIISKACRHQESKAQPSGWSAIVSLLHTGEMRKNTLICCFMWASVTCSYYGITFSSPKFGTDIFLMVFLVGVCELPGGLFNSIIVKLISRKANICSNMLLTAIFCLAYGMFPSGHEWARSAVALLGRITVANAFVFLYLLTSELFPTSHRNVAMGLNSSVARVGAILAAFVVDFVSASYAMIIFGVEMMVAAALSAALHETGNKSLPEDEDDVEHFDELEM